MTLKQKRWVTFAVINGLVLLCIPLYHLYIHKFLPLFPDLMTKCVAVQFLHLYCTGCGGTRAIGALLRCDIIDAFRLNPFVPIAAILFICYDLRAAIAIARGEKLVVKVHNAVWISVAVFLILMTVARNIALVCFGYDPIGDLLAYWH